MKNEFRSWITKFVVGREVQASVNECSRARNVILQMTWQNLVYNLLSGFVGAIVGVVGLLYVQRDAQAKARRAAGRAVLAEMFTNADRALSASSSLVLHEFTDFAWQQQMPLVAHLLSWQELKILVNTYDSAARAFENARDVIKVGEQEVEDLTGKGSRFRKNFFLVHRHRA